MSSNVQKITICELMHSISTNNGGIIDRINKDHVKELYKCYIKKESLENITSMYLAHSSKSYSDMLNFYKNFYEYYLFYPSLEIDIFRKENENIIIYSQIINKIFYLICIEHLFIKVANRTNILPSIKKNIFHNIIDILEKVNKKSSTKNIMTYNVIT